MSRRIHRVRQSIKQRKKQREIGEGSTKNPYLYANPNPMLLSEEEKHGYVTPYSDDHVALDWNKGYALTSHVGVKALLSVLLFAVIAFVLGSGGDRFSTSKQWLHTQLTDEFPFAKLNEWYVTTLGPPLALTPQTDLINSVNKGGALPVLGQVVETFSANGTGIMISPEERSVVSAVDQGVVVFAGNDKTTKKTVVVQHADGRYTTYGFLGSIDVHIYQIVSANQTIGSFTPTGKDDVVYFSVEKDNQFIDPSKVIPVDDLP